MKGGSVAATQAAKCLVKSPNHIDMSGHLPVFSHLLENAVFGPSLSPFQEPLL
ncbi:hypothetical protein [Vibrio methylphosphonaticus]|uniref:hypothetical protein n=1 Tax=Vibrio methylphosphonaticus TaxID=2946866 RepID=UPI00202A761F|nr:hypothetical protein [Vibrio methylphosphonaticus]MCL9775915.1 hypothetical protein [Vibrio methylphosphonaticus]